MLPCAHQLAAWLTGTRLHHEALSTNLLHAKTPRPSCLPNIGFLVLIVSTNALAAVPLLSHDHRYCAAKHDSLTQHRPETIGRA